MGRVVLVTGVSMDLGRRFARRLTEAEGIDRVVGVDVLPPRRDLGRVSFVRADIRNPVIAKIIARENVDTVVHMSIVASPRPGGGRTTMKELNVIGTMQLLAACQNSPSVQQLVVKSSTTYYGASNRDPAMFTEGMNPKRQGSGYAKDVAEIEAYVRGFARRRPDVAITLLRAANVVGAAVGSPLTQYLRLPVIPTVLGFDPRMQFLHDEDMLGVLEKATVDSIPGTFNVAGDGILKLSQVVRRLGRPTLPVPRFAFAQAGRALRQSGLVDFSHEQVDFLTHGRGVDTTRMRTVLGYEPRYDTAGALADFAASVPPGVLGADRIEAAERFAMTTLSGGRNA